MKKQYIIYPFFIFGILFAQDDDLDMDAMWDNTVWNEIEDIADDDSNNIVRNRTDQLGLKADYFTISDKFPEERDPTNDEIEVAIGLVGNFKESPPKEGAKQASRIYTTEQLVEMMEIICASLPTDITPNTYYADEMRYPKAGGYKTFLNSMVKDLNIKLNSNVKEVDIKEKKIKEKHNEIQKHKKIQDREIVELFKDEIIIPSELSKTARGSMFLNFITKLSKRAKNKISTSS